MTITKSCTKSIDINAPVKKVFEFLADGENWPKWAIVNMVSLKRRDDGWYDTVTKFGEGQIKLHLNEELGLVDHTWKDPQATWKVPARVVSNMEGSTFMMTFLQPPFMSESDFLNAMSQMDKEFICLKQLMEE